MKRYITWVLLIILIAFAISNYIVSIGVKNTLNQSYEEAKVLGKAELNNAVLKEFANTGQIKINVSTTENPDQFIILEQVE